VAESKLRALRRSLDLTIHHVAKGVGRSPSWLWYVENGLIEAGPEDLARVEAFLTQTPAIPNAKPRRRKPWRCIE
jgi:transcriptional regulator with XRE-family HTH domain